MQIPPRLYYAAQRLGPRIGVSVDEILLCLTAGPTSMYYHCTIKKKDGGVRPINSPAEPLMKIQRKIDKLILSRLLLSPIAHGYVNKRSIVTNAYVHSQSRSMLSLDLKDAFESTSLRQHLCFKGWDYERRSDHEFGISFAELELILHLIQRIKTVRRVPLDLLKLVIPEAPDEYVVYGSYLPQGAPTSPAAFNRACRSMDEKLEKLAGNVGGVVTRYSDNIVFSMPDDAISIALQNAVVRIIQNEAFSINWQKKRYVAGGNTKTNPLRLVGVNVIDGELYLRPKDIRRLRMKLYCAGKTGDADTYHGVRGHAVQVYAQMPPQLKGVYAKASGR